MTEPQDVLAEARHGVITYDDHDEWLIEDGSEGTAQIVARQVPRWFGRLVVAALVRTPETLDVERLARVLRDTYKAKFSLASDGDWRSDAEYIAAGYNAATTRQSSPTPPEGLREDSDSDLRLSMLRDFLEDEGNYAGGVWGDYGQVVVDVSMVWDIIDGRPHVWEMTAEYVATLNQAKEALAACEERA